MNGGSILEARLHVLCTQVYIYVYIYTEREIEGRSETEDNRCTEDSGRDTMSTMGPPSNGSSLKGNATHPKGDPLEQNGAPVQREVLWNVD